MLSVRDANPADAVAVARVHVRSWQVAYRRLLPDEQLDGLRAEDRAARYVFDAVDAAAPATMLAVDGCGEVCGFATTGPARDGDAAGLGELLALYVDPGRWGQGAGRLLIGHARERLAAEGFREAVLWVLVGNERAQRFYARDGWAPDGTRRDEDLWGVTADEVRYRRSLA
jgi:ribosomal protein S18 acetylase RimI-like enzyme